MPRKGGRGASSSSEAEAPRVRPFWSGTITFGLVSVPVDLYPAHRSSGTSLRMLSPGGAPLRREYYDPETGKRVENRAVRRGYELDDDEYVEIADEELEAAAPEKTRDIALERFVARDQLDPIYFDRAYFLTPTGGATKAYRLLAEVMEKRERAGVARFVMRGREYLVAILAENGILRAETLRFEDEIRTPETVGLPEAPKLPKKAVAAMAKAIRALTVDELPLDELRDEQSRRLRELAEAKLAAGEDVVEAPEAESGESGVIDLMEVLKRSLERSGAPEGRAGPKRASKRGGAKGAAELEERSKKELYEMAQEADIPGRSGMTKDELVEALRSA